MKKHRERLRLSQQDVADILGVTQSTVAMWENGSNKPTYRNLSKLAEAFGITIGELAEESEEKEKSPVVIDEARVYAERVMGLPDDAKKLALDLLDYLENQQKEKE